MVDEIFNEMEYINGVKTADIVKVLNFDIYKDYEY